MQLRAACLSAQPALAAPARPPPAASRPPPPALAPPARPPPPPAARLGSALAAAALCATLLVPPAQAARPRGAEAAPPLVAVLEATRGNEAVRGRVRLAEAVNARGRTFLEVRVDLSGLAPGSTHGLNIHERGGVSCAADPAAACTGPSYNPEGLPHGKPDALKKFGASASHYAGEGSRYWRRAGDLRNVTADAQGEVHAAFEDPVVQLAGEASVAGRALVLHDVADDGVEEPKGVLAYGTLSASE